MNDAAPASEAAALRGAAAPNQRDAQGRRQGLWCVASTPHPDARTTYVDGLPHGPFYWPGGQGWLEGELVGSPRGDDAEGLGLWVDAGEDGVRRSGWGPAVAIVLRSFADDGSCRREERCDGEGRRHGDLRSWDGDGALTSRETYHEGLVDGVWGRRKGARWLEMTARRGRVELSATEAARLGRVLTDVAKKYADPQRFTDALGREVGHYDLLGRALFALIRAGTLDPLLTEAVLMSLSDQPGAEIADVDAILDDPRPYPTTPALLHVAGWPGSIDQLVARVIWERGAAEWSERARGLADPQRRVGLLFFARRFGAELDADEIDEVAAALVDAFGYSWDYQTIAVPGPRVDGLSRDVFRGKRRAEILALFGL